MEQSSALAALTQRFVAFAGIFLLGLIACPLVAFSAHALLPRSVSNWLFFWPQVALVYYGFTVPASDTTHTFLAGGPNFVIAAGLWTVLGLLLAWLLRNRNIAVILVAGLPVSFAVAWVLLWALGLVDIGVYLEGP